MRIRTTAMVTMIVLASASLAIACSVPVFRYALEHWQPDSYIAYIFHESELTDAQLAVVNSLQPQRPDGTTAVNVVVKRIDVTADIDPAMQTLLQNHPAGKLPWVVVQSPPKWGPAQTVWQGELTADTANMVMDSPVRSHVGKRLVDGESVVWVFLDCGRAEEDDAAFALLTEELKKLQTELKLPEIEAEDLGDLSVNPESLRIGFSAVRVSRDDPQERAFIEMLLRVEADLRDEDVVSQPMAFPVFGRGRALYALVGKGIAPAVISEASKFLTGACQCTVKKQNPGVDLLMNVDWDTLVISSEPLDPDLPPLAGFSGFGLPDDQVQPDQEGEGAVATEDGADVIVTRVPEVADPEDVVALATADTADSPQQSNGKTKPVGEEEASPSSGVGQNVMYLLLLLVVGVVVATLFLRPRGT